MQFAVYLVLQIPSAQTFIIKQVTNAISKKIDGQINIERIYFVFFSKAIVKNFSIVSQGDTLLYCNKISVSIPSKELLRLNMNFDKIAITGGEFHLITEDEEKNTNLHRIFKINREREKKEGKGMPELKIRKFKVENFGFRLTNPFKERFKGDSIINFAALDIKRINVQASDISIFDDTLRADIDGITGVDKSGFAIERLEGELTVGPTEARIDNLTLQDNYTSVTARYFSMKYRNSRDFADFTQNVELGLHMENSRLSFKTIGKITPALSESSLALILTGEVTGCVCDLKSEGLYVESESGETAMTLDFSISGLPEIRESICRININECQTVSGDIAKIISGINGKPESELIRDFSPHIKYNFNGTLTGLTDDFVAYGILNSNIGRISADILLKNDTERRGFVIQGEIKSHDFDIGKVINNNLLGELTMESSFSALIKRNSGGIRLSIDNAKINRLEFNDYPYSNIHAAGVYDSTGFDGRIICHDPNLDFLFQGIFAHKEEGGQYDFYANIPYANLNALNFDKRDSISLFRLSILSNIRITEQKDAIGRLNIMDAEYENSYGEYDIGDIELISHNADSNYNAILKAPFMDLEYKATAPLSEFIKKGAELLLYDHIPLAFGKREHEPAEKGDYSLKFDIHNSNAICQVIKPGLYIQDSTKCEIEIDKGDNILLSLNSGRIAINADYLKGVEMKIENRDSLLNMVLGCGNIKIAGMTIDNSNLTITGRENRLNSAITFMAKEGINNGGTFATEICFKEDSIIADIADTSFFTFKENRWSVKPAKIIYSGAHFDINDFALYNNNQKLGIDGTLAAVPGAAQNVSEISAPTDSLRISLENFDISVMNFFINKPFDFQGYFSGSADISTYSGGRNLFLDLRGDSVSVYGHPVGEMRIMSKWYAPDNRLNLLVSSKQDNRTQLMATGYYKPQNGYIKLNASLKEFRLGYFEPFLSDIISETGGSFSGDIKLEGDKNRMKLTGDNCSLDDFRFLVNFTRVPYTLNGTVDISENNIRFEKISIRDDFNGRGIVTGGITHDNFKDIALDTRINFANMQCLALKENENETFYGEAFASGTVGIKGNLADLVLDINVTPNQNSNLHIPLTSASASSNTNLLTFKVPQIKKIIDPYDTLSFNNRKRNGKTDLQINITSNMNSNADMFIEINKELGDIIRANGNGQITLNINPLADLFNIYGDYSINEGSYKFVLPGFSFASRDFVIQQGGNISFNGGIDNINLNLTAIYTTKAAINTLIADTSSVSARRNVNCLISMSGNLMNPRLDFDLEIPDLEPTTKVRVESALNSPDKIQKQFAALLLSGGFLPDERSGITNNSTILYSNVSEMISNQINNIFTQLGIPLDLGLNYQPSDKGSDIFDVAVSTQLFNNRLIINGNIGNDPYSNSNSREVVGNVDVEIKLDRQGKLRLALFSHAADKYSNYLDDSQRSGIGISYQQEFNTFKDIFRKKSKEEKLYRKRAREYRKEQKKKERNEKRAERQNSATAIAEPLQSRQ